MWEWLMDVISYWIHKFSSPSKKKSKTKDTTVRKKSQKIKDSEAEEQWQDFENEIYEQFDEP